jgi:Carboxypeptidase regulatory-like domain
MPRTWRTILLAALLSSGLLRVEARQDTSGLLAGTVMDATGVGLPATTVWVAPNLRITQVEISQIDAAQKALELAELRLRAEQTKFVRGMSVVRFVTDEQHKVAQAEIQRTTLELAASLKLLRAERILTTDATGGFVLGGLAPGSYVIKAFRDGFEPSRLTFVEIKSGQDVKADVTIRPF